MRRQFTIVCLLAAQMSTYVLVSVGAELEVICYAESHDGIEWTKPELDLFALRGQETNNVVLANAAPITHNFCPMLDTRPGVPAHQRFKAVGGTKASGLVALSSADGIHWKRYFLAVR